MSLLAGPSKRSNSYSGYSNTSSPYDTEDSSEDAEDSKFVELDKPRTSELDSDYCQEWDAGTCTKGKKCRFQHRETTSHHKSRGRGPSYDNWLINLASKLKDYEDTDDTQTDLETHPEEEEHEAQNYAGDESLPTTEEEPDSKEGWLEKEDDWVTNEEEWESLFKDLGLKRRQEDVINPGDAGNKQKKIQEKDIDVREEQDPNKGKNDVDRVLKELGRKRREEYSTMDRWGVEDQDAYEPVRGQAFSIPSQNAANIGHYIVLESNLVTCGAGLEIHKVIPGYDLCQISFHLPFEIGPEGIEDILFEYGFSTSDFHIHKIEKTGGAAQITVITDSRLGKKLAEQEKQRFPRERLSFEVRHDAVWTSGNMQGSQPSLTLTWSINAAGDMDESLSVALGEIYQHLSESEGARMETCCVLTPETGSTADQVILMLEFDTWEHVQAAALEINEQPTIQSFECTIPTFYEHSIVIPLAQYEAQRGQWMEMSDTKKHQGTSLYTATSGKGINVHVQGQERTSIGALKVRIEKLVRGEVLEGPYWHPSFASPEDSGVFLRKVMDTAKVYLQCDNHLRILRVYGKPERVGRAQKMIREEVTRREQIMTRTTLTDSSVEFFVTEGFGKLQELVGEKNVDLKITSKWSAIMMQGGEEATHHLRRLLGKSTEPFVIGRKVDPICPVCLSEALYPEILGCGHGYCSGCFNGFLRAAADNKMFPLVCVGKEGKCKKPIALSFIQSFLPHYDFNRLLEVAFASYLEKHPTELRYCRTPDCRQTYRRQTSNAVDLICPSCFARTCSSCGEDHKNMSCEEYRIYRDPEEQERLNVQLAATQGFKRCPRCAVWVEKISGCNHMSCKCGAHICWVCLGVFEPNEIYNHIRRTH